jgi:Uma2 family endonuclease
MAEAVLKIKKEKGFYTYEDYAKLPEGAPYQLIGGKLVMTPAPIPYHQEVSAKLEFKIYEYIQKNKLGKMYHSPIDVYFEETEVYQPDIIFISRERLDIVKENKIEGAPDLVIEILSPTTAYYDLKHKKFIYGKHGVREYWVVDIIDKTVDIYENSGNELILIESVKGDGKIKSKVISGLEIELSEIF